MICARCGWDDLGTGDAHHCAKLQLLENDERPMTKCRRCGSYATLVKSLEQQIKHHRDQSAKYDEAIKTLESERAMNARLTEELEATRAQPAQSAIEQSPDANVEAVRALLLDRSKVGLAKYGTTTAAAGLSLVGWLKHAQLELMDASVYLQAAIAGEQSAIDAAVLAEREALKQAREFLVSMIEFTAPLSNFDGYIRLAMSPHQMCDQIPKAIAAIDAAIRARTAPPGDETLLKE